VFVAAGQKGYDRHVIKLNQVVFGVLIGSVLIALGLVPGLYQRLTEGVRDCHEMWSRRFPSPPHLYGQRHQPSWLAVLGAALIAVAVLAYLSK